MQSYAQSIYKGIIRHGVRRRQNETPDPSRHVFIARGIRQRMPDGTAAAAELSEAAIALV